MKETAAGCFVLSCLAAIVMFGSLLYVGCAVTSDVSKTVRNEFNSTELLKKYEAFKDIASILDAKSASIKVAEAQVESLEKQYKDVPRKEWARVDAEQHSLLVQQVAGQKASYNLLAAEYNARMAKANYAFTNVGDLPKGADTVLPREVKPYVSK